MTRATNATFTKHVPVLFSQARQVYPEITDPVTYLALTHPNVLQGLTATHEYGLVHRNINSHVARKKATKQVVV